MTGETHVCDQRATLATWQSANDTASNLKVQLGPAWTWKAHVPTFDYKHPTQQQRWSETSWMTVKTKTTSSLEPWRANGLQCLQLIWTSHCCAVVWSPTLNSDLLNENHNENPRGSPLFKVLLSPSVTLACVPPWCDGWSRVQPLLLDTRVVEFR